MGVEVVENFLSDLARQTISATCADSEGEPTVVPIEGGPLFQVSCSNDNYRLRITPFVTDAKTREFSMERIAIAMREVFRALQPHFLTPFVVVDLENYIYEHGGKIPGMRRSIMQEISRIDATVVYVTKNSILKETMRRRLQPDEKMVFVDLGHLDHLGTFTPYTEADSYGLRVQRSGTNTNCAALHPPAIPFDRAHSDYDYFDYDGWSKHDVCSYDDFVQACMCMFPTCQREVLTSDKLLKAFSKALNIRDTAKVMKLEKQADTSWLEKGSIGWLAKSSAIHRMRFYGPTYITSTGTTVGTPIVRNMIFNNSMRMPVTVVHRTVLDVWSRTMLPWQTAVAPPSQAVAPAPPSHPAVASASRNPATKLTDSVEGMFLLGFAFNTATFNERRFGEYLVEFLRAVATLPRLTGVLTADHLRQMIDEPVPSLNIDLPKHQNTQFLYNALHRLSISSNGMVSYANRDPSRQKFRDVLMRENDYMCTMINDLAEKRVDDEDAWLTAAKKLRLHIGLRPFEPEMTVTPATKDTPEGPVSVSGSGSGTPGPRTTEKRTRTEALHTSHKLASHHQRPSPPLNPFLLARVAHDPPSR